MSPTHVFSRCAAIVRTSALAGLILVSASMAWADNAPEDGVRIESGAGKFTFVDRKGDASKRMSVYTYVPAKLKAEAATIVFVMHGAGKNADGYRDVWAPLADKHGFMVVAPLFDPETWGSTYSTGQGMMRDGKPTDPAMWSFSVIEHLFDAIKTATGNKSATYRIYGHSEGGQFVHRLVWFLPEARYEKAVAANPGWYTMPDLSVALPYGLGNSPTTERTMKQGLERNLTVLLGSRDNDPNHPQLRKTTQAMAQGRFRLERGQNFFKQAGERCAELKCKFGWQLQIVPGAAHSNGQMAAAAAAVLMEGK
jgi:hypothetical protein